MAKLVFLLCILPFVFQSEGRIEGCFSDFKNVEQCQLDEFLVSAFHESESILTNSYSFVPDRQLAADLNQTNENSTCRQHLYFLGERINEITNSILSLVNHIVKQNEFRDQMKTIKNGLKCLTEVMSQANLQNNTLTSAPNFQKFSSVAFSRLTQLENIAGKMNNNSSKPNATTLSTCKIQLDGVAPASYLYAHNSYGDDKLQRPVYVGSSSGSESNWILEPQNDNGVFKLKNSRYGEYFGSYVPWLTSSGQSTLAVTSSQYYTECSNRFIWTIVNDSAGKSRIRHSDTSSYLIAPVAYPSRVAVLHKSTTAVYWKLICTG